MTPSYMRPDQRHGTLATDRKHRPFALLFVLTVTLFVGLPAAALAQSRPQFVDGSVDGNTLTMTFDRALMEDLSGENAEYFPRFYFGVWERKEPVFLPNEPDPAGRIFPVVDGVRVRGNSVTLTLERVVEPMVLVWVYFHNLSINPPIRDLNGVNPGTFVKQVTNRTGLTPPTQPGRPNSLQGKPDDKRRPLAGNLRLTPGGRKPLPTSGVRGSPAPGPPSAPPRPSPFPTLKTVPTTPFMCRPGTPRARAPQPTPRFGRPAGCAAKPHGGPGNQQVRIRWSPPANDDGSPIRRYEWKQGSGGTWTSTSTTTTALATNLIPMEGPILASSPRGCESVDRMPPLRTDILLFGARSISSACGYTLKPHTVFY